MSMLRKIRGKDVTYLLTCSCWHQFYNENRMRRRQVACAKRRQVAALQGAARREILQRTLDLGLWTLDLRLTRLPPSLCALTLFPQGEGIVLRILANSEITHLRHRSLGHAHFAAELFDLD